MSGDLINTLEAPGEFDALTTLRPNEPYFLLVGRDGSAPDLVCQWADTNRRRALADFDAGRIDKDKRETELRKSTQAEMIAASMREYKAGHDPVAETRNAPSYTGHELPEETKRRDKRQRLQASARSAVTNAIAELTVLLPLLDESDDFHAVASSVEGLRGLERLADALTPARPIGAAA
ncbi:MAG: hypothetical protein ACR652_17585 [Methylocystis sp.]|uniref:hypothetical protein n=1 Tax=Methylocystis sp. TaxID=1911079 RepID=UPI003DA232D5